MTCIFKYISRVLGAALLLMGTPACVKNLQEMEWVDGSENIVFIPSLQAEGLVQTRANAGALSCEEEMWPLSPATKAAPVTALSGSAGLIGFCYDTWNESTSLPWTAKMYNTEYSFDNLKLSASGAPVQWIYSTEDYLRVFAYAPKSFVDGVAATLTSGSTAGTPKIHYTVPSDVANQKDLIAASATVAGNYRNSIPLAFTHALTAVRIKMGFACTVKSVTISGVKNVGDYAIGGAWSGQSGTASYSFSFNGGDGTAFAKDALLNDGANTLMLLPQNLPDDAEITLVYDEGAGEKTADYSLKDFVWQAGKRVTYTLNKNTISYIYFDLAAGNVLIEDGSYSGYVYTYNGTGDPVEVSGTHDNSNQYYIYQSTSANRTSTGWTGAVGSTMNLPVYPEVRTDNGSSWSTSSGAKTWREFITNNSNIASVINGWGPAATARGTAATSHTIKINGNMTVDLTVDNIWSDFHQNVQHRTTAALLIGPGGKYPSERRYERVTLRLKGDNHLHNILYYGHPNNQPAADRAYFKITSADGDGSPNGSLTVTVPTTGMALTGACTIMGGGDDDDTPPCNDMWFYGGTTYVASSLGISDSDATGVLGGGTNNSCNIKFEGGVVTSVAYSNGAAIGGGGGFNSNGGDGTVTINGGKIYAYQSGTYSNSKTQALATAAIGGGSSYNSAGNAGTVTINGGEVFAQSIGGVALGGGSSGSIRGGSATITITGGTVIAKSVTGRLGGNASYQRDIPGSSIGGGTGGLSAYGTGGTATVTISDGTLLAGSIGGGGTISTAGASIGSAQINISGGDIQGQFVMAAGASDTPSFTMSGGTIRNSDTSDSEYPNIHSSGGAVYMEDGEFTMTAGQINNCSATTGGAVHVNGGTFSMSNGTIQDCVSTSHGGAIYMEGGTVTISGGTITHNNASGTGACGGGLYLRRGTFSMPAGSTGEISNNYANYDGGGVYVTSVIADVTVEVLSGSIIGNSSAYRGGGLCVRPGEGHRASITLGIEDVEDPNPNISGNETVLEGGGLYAAGADAYLDIYSGLIKNNRVSSIVANQDVANYMGMVTLHGGDVDYKTVTFNANGGVGSDQTVKIVTATNSVLVIPDAALAFTKTDYHLGGWNTATDGTGTSYINGQVINISSNITLYARWLED